MQTPSTKTALIRDEYRCIWCLYFHSRRRSVFGDVGNASVTALGGGHHIFGRGRVDVPEAIIGLCAECHTAVHAGKITKCQLMALMLFLYPQFNLFDLYREFHDCDEPLDWKSIPKGDGNV